MTDFSVKIQPPTQFFHGLHASFTVSSGNAT